MKHICKYCKKPACITRVYKNRTEHLCDSKECDKLSRVSLGIFITAINIPKKD